MGLSKEKIDALDKELLELMAQDFEHACNIARVDKIQAFVCIERKKGKSYGTIANTIGVSKIAVFNRAKSCVCK